MSTQSDQRRSVRKAGFLILAFAMISWAACLLRNDDYPFLPLLLPVFAVGSILFVLGSPRPAPWAELPPKEGMSPRQKLLVAASLAGSSIAFVFFWLGRDSDGQFTGFPLFLWLLSMLAFWLGSGDPHPLKPLGWKKIPLIEPLLLLAILAAALFLRTYRLDVFPNGCQTDECNNGFDALGLLKGKPYAPYVETNEGQATLFSYLLALSFEVFGVGVIQMRLVSALIGALTVAAFYFLARDWLEWRFALAATAMFAVARWHLTFSRIVYELILTPLAEILVFLFFLRALQNGRLKDWALAGLCLAFGMNTYTGFRVIPILIALYLVYWFITHFDRIRRDVEGAVYMGFGFWIGMTPLTVYILQRWDIFMQRTRRISILNDIADMGGSWQPLQTNIGRTLSSFHWRGDMAALNNLPGEPLLDVVVGVLVLFGLAYALRYAGHPLKFLYVIWTFAGLSLAIFSSINEVPTARRPIGLLPVIFLMSGTALQLAAGTFRDACSSFSAAWYKKMRHIIPAGEGLLLGIVVAAVGILNINTFYAQTRDRFVRYAYDAIDSAVGEYLRDLPGENRVFLDPDFDNYSPIDFISRSRPYAVLDFSKHVPVTDVSSPPVDVTYILSSSNEMVKPLLEQIYPDGIWRTHTDPYGDLMFFTFEVPSSVLARAGGIVGKYESDDGGSAFTRLEPSLDFQWETTHSFPFSTPFHARWSGSIFFPNGYNEYRLAIRTGGQAQLSLDGSPVLKTPASGLPLVSETVLLTGGFHTFEMTYQDRAAPHTLTLLWEDPDLGLVPIPASAFFHTVPARHGLTGYYYPNKDRSGPARLIQHDLFIMPNDALPEPFGIIWKGKIQIPRAGQYVLGVVSDDGSHVYVDGQLLVDNGGEGGVFEAEGVATFDEGLHDLEIHYWQIGGGSTLQFWWEPPGASRSNVPLEYLFPEEKPDVVNP